MGNQFKVGDLALTKVSLGSYLSAGSVVELYKPYYPGDNLGSKDRPLTVVAPGWWCAHAEKGDRLPFAERNLMPLLGDFASEDQKQAESEPCT